MYGWTTKALLNFAVPELPDVTVYLDSIQRTWLGSSVTSVRVPSPFVLRTFEPEVSDLVGRRLTTVRRIGKRVALGFSKETEPTEIFCVIHLMVAGRLRKRPLAAPLPRKLGIFAVDFADTSLWLTEAGTKKRASVHLFRNWQQAMSLHRGGAEPLTCGYDAFAAAVRQENRTIKRVLCDPRLISGIGNAYSDEILFWAELSPTTRTHSLSNEQMVRLYVATLQTLRAWTRFLSSRLVDGFPEKVTAFHPEMAVHGRYKLPCRQCGTRILRIVHASNDTNYCPRCQTGGKVLADRALSRLLRADWPRNIDELEERAAGGPAYDMG